MFGLAGTHNGQLSLQIYLDSHLVWFSAYIVCRQVGVSLLLQVVVTYSFGISYLYEVSLHVKVFNSGVFHRFLERVAAIPTVRLNRQLQDLEACLNYNLLTDKPSYRLLCHFGLDYSSLIFPEVSWGKNMGDKVIPVKVAVRVRPLVPKEVRILTTCLQYSLW